MVRECVACGEERKCKPRADYPLKPQARCPECSKTYQASWRKKNWQRAKARDTWKGMIARCHDPRHGRGSPPGVPRYSEYGARGTKVCRRWRGEGGFKRFVADMGLPPMRESTLDRKRPTRNYTKSNCRWVDKQTQHENKRGTHWLIAPNPETGEDVELCLTAWQNKTGISRHTIRERLTRGWSADDAVSLPPLAPGVRYGVAVPQLLEGDVPF